MKDTIKDIRSTDIYKKCFEAKFGIDLSNGKSKAKFPANWQKIKNNFTTEDNKNIAILTGKVNNIIVVDIDRPKENELDGLEYFEKNVCKLDSLNTLITKTPGGGYHIYFKYNEKIKTTSRIKDIKSISIDIRNNGACIFEGVDYELYNASRELEEVPEAFIDIVKKEGERLKLELSPKFSKLNKTKEINGVNIILENLTSNFYDNYQDWFNVLCVLKNLDINKDIAINFSSRSDKFDLEVFNKTWESIEKRDKPGFGTLIYFLKQSVIRQKYENLLKKIINESNFKQRTFKEFCKLFYELYKDEIIVNEMTNEIYIMNKYGIWEKKNSNSKYFLEKLDNFENYLKEKCIEFDLDSSTKYNIFITEALRYFQIEIKKWNCNPFVFPFNNGVIDLQTGNFRKGLPNEYINYTTGYDYKKVDNLTNINKFFSDVLQNEQIRKYFINILSLALEDINRRQEIYFCLGEEASNGKSTVCELLERAFGEFGCRFPTNLITSGRENSNQANSSMMVLKNKRFGYCSEPEKNKQINVNVVKEMTGDTISARDLNQKQESFKINALLFLIQNVMSKLDEVDNGTIRRVRTIPFDAKFVDNPILPNERIKRPFTYESLENLKLELINLLINNYFELKKNNFEFETPEPVKIASEEYINESNELDIFLADNYEIGDGSIQIKEIQQELKNIRLTYNNNLIKQSIKRLFKVEVKDKTNNKRGLVKGLIRKVAD